MRTSPLVARGRSGGGRGLLLTVVGFTLVLVLVGLIHTLRAHINLTRDHSSTSQRLQVANAAREALKSEAEKQRKVLLHLQETNERLTVEKAQSTEDKQHAMDDAQACAAAKQTVQGELESAINLAESEKRRNQQMISAFESKSRELDRMLAQLAEAHSYGRACNASKTKFQSECSKVPRLEAAVQSARAQAEGSSRLIFTLIKGKTQHGKPLGIVPSLGNRSVTPSEERVVPINKDADLDGEEQGASENTDGEGRAAPATCTLLGSLSNSTLLAPTKTRIFTNDGPRGDIDYSHMAMMAQMPPKAPWRWIAVWQSAHSKEGTDDQHFRCAFSQDARGWTASVSMSGMRELAGPVWGPVLHTVGDVLWLFYSESPTCKRSAPAGNPELPNRWCPGGHIKYIKSENGIRWTKPVTIYTQEKDGNVPKVLANQMIITRKGRWLLPFWQEPPSQWEPTVACPSMAPHKAGVLYSMNQGKSWKVSDALQDTHTYLFEGTLAQLANDTILQGKRVRTNNLEVNTRSLFKGSINLTNGIGMCNKQLFRTNTGAVYQSFSYDEGVRWSTPEPTSSLPNPNSKLNLIRLEGSDVLAVGYNHMGGPNMPRARSNLFVSLSLDSGSTWHKISEIETDPSVFSQWHYPTLAQEGCRLFVAYSSLHKSMYSFEDPKVIGGVHLAEIDLSRADLSERSLLPLIDWKMPWEENDEFMAVPKITIDGRIALDSR